LLSARKLIGARVHALEEPHGVEAAERELDRDVRTCA
jgi:hypothetical protein